MEKVDSDERSGWDDTELPDIPDINDMSDNLSINSFADQCRQKIKKLSDHLTVLRHYSSELVEKNAKIQPLLSDIEPELKRLAELKRIRNFILKLQQVNFLHEKIEMLSKQARVKTKQKIDTESNLAESLDVYCRLRESFISLQNVPDDNPFKKYCKEILLFWRKKLEDSYLTRFQEVLTKIHWPIGVYDLAISMDDFMVPEVKDEFKYCFDVLLKFDTDHLIKKLPSNRIHICYPLFIMVEPLKKRFFYHFYTNARTNQLGKPEWYLTQILNWIKDHENFLLKHVDPILALYDLPIAPSKIQFTCALLELVKEKLQNDLPKAVNLKNQTFPHMFDEVVQFSRELEMIIGSEMLVLKDAYNLLNPFALEPYFSKLKKIEEKRSMEFLETIFSSESAWIPILNPIDDEDDDFELIVPEIADNFVLMLQSITDRSSHLSSKLDQLAFVELELDMLDDFRLRLSQLIRMIDEGVRWPFSQRFFSILNSLNYLIIVLEEWQTLPEMSDIKGTGSIFDDPILVYNHMLKEMHSKIVSSLMNQFKAKMFRYSNMKWHCLSTFDDGLQVTSYELFYFISKALETLKRNLSRNIFEIMCATIAEKIKESFFDDLIAKNSFNSGGAEQLHRDISINLLSVFRDYSPKPEALFPELIEAYRILNLPRGIALLLQDALKSKKPKLIEDNLKDQCINHLSSETVQMIISKRLYI